MTRRLILLSILLLAVLATTEGAKRKYPGGRCHIYRYQLCDKQGTTERLDRPQRWLSPRSIERRRRQGLALDSTDLPVSPTYLRQLRVRGTTFVGSSRWNNTVLLCSHDSLLLEALGQLPFVSSCVRVWTSPDSIERPVRMNIHEQFNKWDSLRNDPYGAGRGQIEMLGGDRLHEAGFRGRGMLIAVLDGGFHNIDRLPQFRSANIEAIRDVTYHDANRNISASEAPLLETDHGTKVLSVMAAQLPEVLTGTAPEAAYWLIRCEDTATEQLVEEDYWAIAAELADSAGVDIISSSLGYNRFDDPRQDHTLNQLDGQSTLISRTASLLARKGIVLCNSAGNSGMGPWKKIGVPADAYDILTVGAVDEHRQNAAFSSVGPAQDGRVKPDVMAQGSPTVLISGRGTLVRDMGTSFSTPIVSGLVACLWQALPSKTALDIIDLVRHSADNYATPNNIFGYGLPDFWRAYQSTQPSQP